MENNITYDNCVSLAVDNTSLNVGRNNSVIVEARKKNEHIILMGCQCHIAYNAASKATKAFVKVVDNFDVEELIVDIYFHFHYSPKRKTVFVEFCELCDQQYCKTIKFHKVRLLVMSPCIERVLRLLPSLKSYFESLDPKMKMEWK